MITYGTIILVSWMALLLVWGISAFFVKRDIRGGGMGALWQRHWALRLAAAAIISVAAIRLGRNAGSPGAALVAYGIFAPPPAIKGGEADARALSRSLPRLPTADQAPRPACVVTRQRRPVNGCAARQTGDTNAHRAARDVLVQNICDL